MASAESLKPRAPRSNGGGPSLFAKEMRLLPLAAEYLGAAQPRAVPTEEGYPTDPADPFAAAKPIDWSRHPVDSPLHGVAVPGAGPYPEELLEARRALEPDPSASYMGETLAGWRKTIPTYDPIYGAPQQPRSEFAIPRGIASLGQKTLDMVALQSVDPAALMGLGSLGSRPKGSLGTFGTEQAKDLTPRMGRQYENARQLLNRGEPPEKVERLTGLAVISLAGNEAAEFKYSQSRDLSDLFAVRHHIPDDEMTLKPAKKADTFENEVLKESSKTSWIQYDEPRRLGDVISHPKLFEAYPSLKDVRVVGSADMGDVPARWLPSPEGLIQINRKIFDNISSGGDERTYFGNSQKELLRKIMHEVSHATQDAMEEGTVPPYFTGSTIEHEYRKRHVGPLIGKKRPDLLEPNDYESAKLVLEVLNAEVDLGWLKMRERDINNLQSPITFSSADELTFQRNRFMKDRASRDKKTTFTDEVKRLSTEEFNELRDKRNDWVRKVTKRGAKDSSLKDYYALVDKIKQAVELEHRIIDSEHRYLDNLGERQARASELLMGQPKHPSIQFNKIFERLAEVAKKKGLREGGLYPDITDLLPEQHTETTLGHGLFSAQHMDAMADAVSPKTASGHKINTAFGLGKMKTPKGKNKGGYVTTAAETMIGLD